MALSNFLNFGIDMIQILSKKKKMSYIYQKKLVKILVKPNLHIIMTLFALNTQWMAEKKNLNIFILLSFWFYFIKEIEKWFTF